MVVPFFDRVGGYEKQAFSLSRSLVKAGAWPFILTENFRGLPGHEIRERVEINRINPRPLHSQTQVPAGPYDPRIFFLNRLTDIQLIHCHAWSPFSGEMIALGRKFGIKTLVKVATERDIQAFHDPQGYLQRENFIENIKFSSEKDKNQWIRDIEGAFHKIIQSDYFISLNNNISRELMQIGIAPEKIIPITNGVDTELYKPLSDPKKREAIRARHGLANQKTIIFVGRLVERKCCEDLLLAFSKITGEFPEMNLAFLGDGEERPRLEERATLLNLGTRVQFLGERTDVAEILQVTDLFVFPSRLEGNPNALLEAMATQLPIVATYISGHVELVTHGENGLLTPPREPQRLAETMRFLLHRPDMGVKIGEKARRTVLEKMSFNVLAMHYIKIYEEIANGESPHEFSNYRSFRGYQFHQAKDLNLKDPDRFFREYASRGVAYAVQNLEAKIFSPSCNICRGEDHEVVDGSNRRLLKGLKIVRCRRCGHIYLNPRIGLIEDIHSTTLDYLKNCYLKEYTNLGCLRREKKFLAKANYRYHLPYLEAISPFRSCNRILDYGCAIGLFLQAAKMDGWECCGFEMSPLLSLYGQENFRLNIRCGILEESDLSGAFFDAITLIEVVEHLFHPAAALAKAYELLRPGGIALITTPNYQSLERFLSGKDWEIFVSDHQHYFTSNTLKNLLQQNNFEILKMHTSAVNLQDYNQRYGYERVKEAVERHGITSENINLLFGASIICLAQKAEGI